MNNELNVFNLFCRAGLFYDRVILPRDAQKIATDLNRQYKNFGLHLSWQEVLNKNYQELYVYLDKWLARRFNFINSLFKLSPAQLN